ncbi:MAG: serine/threonine protein kinase [Gammaproteobacteria bacterium]
MHNLSKEAQPYQDLTPDLILDAVESFGVRVSGSILALNSYENRVYQVGLEEGAPLVAKFYRPGRWSDAAILEEHAFALELAGHEIPVVAPLQDAQGRTLLEYRGYRFALFPRRGGRWPELDNPDNLLWLGRFIGRIHAVGAARPFRHRPALTVESFGTESLHYLMEHGFVPKTLERVYHDLVEDLLGRIRAAFDEAGDVRRIRVHGDCHPGNILWTDHGPHFVDLDDCRTAPAIQDLWMLLSGDRTQMTIQLSDLLEGYEEFHEFDRRELRLIEPLRTLRMIHYSAWLARRWHDPAFPLNFPWFNTEKYWEEQVVFLREQAARLEEPVLQLY